MPRCKPEATRRPVWYTEAVSPVIERFLHPVLEARALGREPARVVVDGRAYVLFRDDRGQVGALLDRCPHRFAPLSAGRVRPDGRLACPYHGWHFDLEGRGASPSQPSLTRCDATALIAREHAGLIWIGAPGASGPPTFAWEDFVYSGAFTVPFAAPLHVCLDNFSEDEHTPWVHTRLGWREEDAGKLDFEAHNFDDRTEVAYRGPQRPSPLGRPFGVLPGDRFHNEWTTRFEPVHTLYTIYWTSPEGARRPVTLRAGIFMVPVTERTTLFAVSLFLRIESFALRAARPALTPLIVELVKKEIEDDARFIPTVADTPLEMDGMRLGRFDKPLVHNRKLLRRLYWDEAEGGAPRGS